MSGRTDHAAPRIAAAIYSIAKGPAAAVVKPVIPEIAKAAAIIIALALLLPTLIFAALPNILFGYDNASATDVIDWTDKAYSIDAAYREVQNYTQEEIDRIIAEKTAEYDSDDYDEVEVDTDTDNTNIYWFIAITSVSHQQDLFTMDEDSIKNMTVKKLISFSSIVPALSDNEDDEEVIRTLKIDIKDLDPEDLMDKLGFNDDERNWAQVLYDTLDGTSPQREESSNRMTPQSGYSDYKVPEENLKDGRVAAMVEEGDKYLGYPYVYGGSSPSESFDCSGFVCWVINHSGVGSVGRTTAQGLYELCSPISPDEAKPGDLVFFENTYVTTDRVTHVGIYVGDGMMLHCGSPVSYAKLGDSYYQSHFYGFGRLKI